MQIAPPADSQRERRRLVWIAFVVVLVVVALVVAAYGVGFWPFGPERPSTAIASTGYVQADALAVGLANAEGGAPWSTIYASGIATPSAVQVPQQWLYPFPGGCGATNVEASPNSSETVSPGYGATAYGTAPFWTIFLINGSAVVREFLVQGGSVGLIDEQDPTPTCLPWGPPLTTSPAVLDSLTIVPVAWAAGGSSFVAHFPNATLSLFLTAGPRSVHHGPSQWVVRWSTCLGPFLWEKPGANTGESDGFIVNATTGLVTETLPTGSFLCSSATATPAASAANGERGWPTDPSGIRLGPATAGSPRPH